MGDPWPSRDVWEGVGGGGGGHTRISAARKSVIEWAKPKSLKKIYYSSIVFIHDFLTSRHLNLTS